MNKESKTKILKAFFDGIITKDEMIFLFEVGIIIPPIIWKYPSEEEQKRQEKKRDLVEKIFDRKFPKVTWI